MALTNQNNWDKTYDPLVYEFCVKVGDHLSRLIFDGYKNIKLMEKIRRLTLKLSLKYDLKEVSRDFLVPWCVKVKPHVQDIFSYV